MSWRGWRLPSPPSGGDKNQIYYLTLVPCGLVLVGGAGYVLVKRQQKKKKLCAWHETKILKWVKDQEHEVQEKKEYMESQEITDEVEIARYRVDMRTAYRLWEDGRTLGCDAAIMNKIVVKCAGNRGWWKNFKQFLKLMLVGSRTRMLSVGTTAAFAVVLAQIANEQSCCREGLLHAIKRSKTTTAHELLKWFARDLGIIYLNAFVSYLAEAFNAFLVKQSSVLMWRQFYSQLVIFDIEIFDRQEVGEYLGLEDAIYDAEAALQTFLQSIMDLGTRLIMIYTRGGVHLTACVLSFWSCAYMARKPLEHLRAMLAKQDYVGRHDLDDEDMEEENVSYSDDEYDDDAIKVATLGPDEDMKNLFEHIHLARSFGRGREMMQALIQKKYGRDATSLFNLDEFLGYCFPPVKDWLIICIELLCTYTCTQLLGDYVQGGASAMHILIKETWNALGTAPNSLNPHFVLNHIDQVATVMNILDYKPKIETEGGYRPEKLHGVIELVNVSFAYPARRDRKVLSNLSFKAEQGSMVGLVGPSGSGKSTIFQLLMRFYDPTEGQVLLDGVDLKEYDVVWLRKRIGEVKQSTKLFEMSVEDNIRFGCADATRAEVVQAAKLANAFNFIMSLPEAFNTVIGDNAIRLSGGQMQRIAIARAFLTKPSILLLDEYSSALDTQSEMEVQQAVTRLVDSGCTTFVIAHRLQTVESANQIVVLQRGRCVESGTHEQLLQQGGLYTRLDTMQQSMSRSPLRLCRSMPDRVGFTDQDGRLSFGESDDSGEPRETVRKKMERSASKVMKFNLLSREMRKASTHHNLSVPKTSSLEGDS